MGRSVSYANGSEVVIYSYIEPVIDDEDNYDEFLTQLAWDDAIYNLKYEAKEAFPSLEDCDEWLGREDHAILENNLVYIGISEYMNIVSVWVVPKEDEHYAFGVSFAKKIEAKLNEVVKSAFGLRLNQVGRFSNGEAVFSKAI
jgi:hypothetical protein